MGNKIKSFFKFEERGATFRGEIVGGLVTFLAMSYILAVNPMIINNGGQGVPLGGAFIATALGSFIAILIMGFVGNLPVALAPGMGVNAFFIYVIVGQIGYTWQEALAISLVSGVIFVSLTFTKFRSTLIDAIPKGLKAAIGVGIGFFIAFVGLQNAGIIVSNPATLVALGSFADPNVLMALFGIILIIVLYNLRGKISNFAFILSILITAGLYALLGIAGVSAFKIDSFYKYKDLSSFKETFGAFIPGFKTLFQDSTLIREGANGVPTEFVFTSAAKLITLPVIVFALLFVDIFDTAGTLVAVTKAADLVDENGKIINVDRAMFADSTGTLISSTFGTPQITSFVESATGVSSGARTGFANMITGILFLLSIALYPLMAIFDLAPVTSMALVLVGVLMASQIEDVDWSDKPTAIAAFITILGMILTYSVADGIAFGFIVYSVAMLAARRGKEVHPMIYSLSVVFIFYFFLYSIDFNLLK